MGIQGLIAVSFWVVVVAIISYLGIQADKLYMQNAILDELRVFKVCERLSEADQKEGRCARYW